MRHPDLGLPASGVVAEATWSAVLLWWLKVTRTPDAGKSSPPSPHPPRPWFCSCSLCDITKCLTLLKVYLSSPSNGTPKALEQDCSRLSTWDSAWSV